MLAGDIVILNGASSAGKTSILKALQETLETPYLDAGIDRFLWMLPGRYLDAPLWHQVFDYSWQPDGAERQLAIKAGPLGHQLMTGMHKAIAALALAGNHVIADHVLIERQWVRECAALFAGLRAFLIGIHCPLEILEQRERARQDRTLGQARAYLDKVHAHSMYDLEIDTSLMDPLASAVQIKRRIQDKTAPQAFSMLNEQLNGHQTVPDQDP